MIAIIPARGGSKGVPGKNIKNLCGKPLIAYTIEAALNAECIDDVVVTTDSEEIAEISRSAGARVPFMRPADLAGDTSSAVDVYIHALDFLEKEKGTDIEKFFVLLPTAPFRTADDIDQAYADFQREKPDTLIAVKEADVPPSWYLSLDGADRLARCGFDGSNIHNNRQKSSKYYHACGAIYILDKKLLINERTYFSGNTLAFVMDNSKAVDIDTIEDFEYAEYLMAKKTNCLGKDTLLEQ